MPPRSRAPDHLPRDRRCRVGHGRSDASARQHRCTSAARGSSRRAQPRSCARTGHRRNRADALRPGVGVLRTELVVANADVAIGHASEQVARSGHGSGDTKARLDKSGPGQIGGNGRCDVDERRRGGRVRCRAAIVGTEPAVDDVVEAAAGDVDAASRAGDVETCADAGDGEGNL